MSRRSTVLSNARIDAIAKAQDDDGWLVKQLTSLEWRWFARDIERAVMEALAAHTPQAGVGGGNDGTH